MAINFKDWQKTLHEEVETLDEKLVGDQHKLDVDKDGKIEKSDLKKLRNEENLDELDASTLRSYRYRVDHEIDTKPEKDRSQGMRRAQSRIDAQDSGKKKEKIVVNKGENVKQEEIDTGEYDARKTQPSSKEQQDKVFAKHKERMKKLRNEEGCSKKSFREFVEELEEAKKDDYWDFKDLKDEPKSTTRKIAGKAYGGAAQKDDDEDDKPAAKPTEKRGRGRPSGSKSGARQKGNGNNYGGLAIHSLNLPSKK